MTPDIEWRDGDIGDEPRTLIRETPKEPLSLDGVISIDHKLIDPLRQEDYIFTIDLPKALYRYLVKRVLHGAGNLYEERLLIARERYEKATKRTLPNIDSYEGNP